MASIPVIRAQIHGTAAPVYRGYCIWRGIADDPGGIVRGHISETWGSGQRFGILPMGQGRICWYATRNGPPSQSESPQGRKVEVQELFQNWHQPIPALIEATRRFDRLDLDPSRLPVRAGGVETAVLGRVDVGVVFDDAAECPPPPHATASTTGIARIPTNRLRTPGSCQIIQLIGTATGAPVENPTPAPAVDPLFPAGHRFGSPQPVSSGEKRGKAGKS